MVDAHPSPAFGFRGRVMGDKKLSDLPREEFDAVIDGRRKARMDRIDALTPVQRHLVNEYGFTVVNAFMLIGVTKVKHIRHLVEVVLNEFSPTRGGSANQGTRRAPGVGEPVPPPGRWGRKRLT